MSFPRYERYKDSGIEWLGAVPEHWDVKRLRFALRLVTDRPDGKQVTVISLENVESWTGKLIETETTYAGEGVAFHGGDILFGKLRPYLAKAYLAEAPGAAVGDFHVLRPARDTSAKYAQYWFFNQAFIQLLDGSTIGAKMPRVGWPFLADVAVPVPNLSEQEGIVALLDQETAKIDALIEEQRRLIELLKEKRQAIISHAVTKGLNPSAGTLDSGCAWLGAVPEHWDVVPFGYLVQVYSGGTPDKANEAFWDGSIPWASPKDMKVEELAGSQDHITDIAVEHSKLTIFSPGHLLLVVRGMILAHTVPVARNLVPLTINQDMKAIRCGQRVEPVFLQYFFMGVNELIVSLASESAHGTLKLETPVLTHLPIPVPPREEQLQICAKLTKAKTDIDDLIVRSQAAISLLTERRSALISAAVTGKIDVRNYTSAEACA